MMRRRWRIVGLGVALLLGLLMTGLLAGCASSPSVPTFGRPDDRIAVSRGTTFDIVLDANASVGDDWRVVGQPDRAVAEPSGENHRSDSDLPGSPGQDVFSFRATGAGTTTISIFNCYRCVGADQPTAENQRLSQTLRFTLTVTG